jgi:hypothetical protein
MCNEADRAVIANTTPRLSSLADRELIVGLLARTTAPCVRCILQTISSVCGTECVKERLHIATDFGIAARPCLPELQRQLARGEGRLFAAAIAAGEPFGLVLSGANAKLRDLYVPLRGKTVYRGVDSGALAYACDATHGTLWALSALQAASDVVPTACVGELWIDGRTGEARDQLHGGNATHRVYRRDAGHPPPESWR